MVVDFLLIGCFVLFKKRTKNSGSARLQLVVMCRLQLSPGSKKNAGSISLVSAFCEAETNAFASFLEKKLFFL
jgi:hypothetical protein